MEMLLLKEKINEKDIFYLFMCGSLMLQFLHPERTTREILLFP
jgi:hypothetical protein